MKAHTTIMTFDSFWAVIVLHGKIIPDGSGTVPDKIERPGEAATRKKVVKQIVQCSLEGNPFEHGKNGSEIMLTLRTWGGLKSDGNVLSPAARSYIFTARLWSTRFVPGI